ncbi:MAG: hypothetical protein IPH62_19455 [Ignavibacteriae bacterium]|nr:hypothetical protein [Ignavibacteriota bacterium]
MIEHAKEFFPCQDAIDKLDSFKTIEEILTWDKTPFCCYWYAYYVANGRVPILEPIILKNSGAAYCYAKYVIWGRWPEGEKIIKKSRQWGYQYKEFASKVDAGLIKKPDYKFNFN